MHSGAAASTTFIAGSGGVDPPDHLRPSLAEPGVGHHQHVGPLVLQERFQLLPSRDDADRAAQLRSLSACRAAEALSELNRITLRREQLLVSSSKRVGQTAAIQPSRQGLAASANASAASSSWTATTRPETGAGTICVAAVGQSHRGQGQSLVNHLADTRQPVDPHAGRFAAGRSAPTRTRARPCPAEARSAARSETPSSAAARRRPWRALRRLLGRTPQVLVDGLGNLFRREGLGHEARGPQADGRDRVGHAGIARHEDHRHVRLLGRKASRNWSAVHFGHLDVQEHGGEVVRWRPALRPFDGIAALLDRIPCRENIRRQPSQIASSSSTTSNRGSSNMTWLLACVPLWFVADLAGKPGNASGVPKAGAGHSNRECHWLCQCWPEMSRALAEPVAVGTCQAYERAIHWMPLVAALQRLTFVLE